MKPELPADIRALVDRAIDVARKKLEGGGELTGMAFVEMANGFLVLPTPHERLKDAWARFVRETSAIVGSRFVLLVSEVWLNETTDRAELERLLDQYKEVRYFPGSRDGVVVQVETHDGLWKGDADVVPFPLVKGGRTFGAVELEMPPDQEGRFASLLGRQREARQ